MRTAKQTDKRVTVMSEIITGMRIIKMYCWESSFKELISGIRRSEIHIIRLVSYLSALLETISRQGRYFCIYATVLFYFLSGDAFRTSELYVVVGLLNSLSMQSLLFVALAIKHAAQANVTMKRITSFLKLGKLNTDTQEIYQNGLNYRTDSSTLATTSPAMTSNVGPCGAVYDDKNFITIESVTATWDETTERPTLQSVSATVSENQLVTVIGEVGSGKSSLLLAMLKELPLMEGAIRHCGRLSFVSQQPWVFSSSIRENILFGSEYDKASYHAIIKACALDKDIALLPKGDETLIGDRGVRLSGGQRARISLARALYKNGDIYLLDDPFSAVDTNVAKHIFENVIQGILKNKAKILVTHSLQFLNAADNIIILKQGEVVASGTFEALSHSGVDFASLLKHQEDDNAQEDSFTRDDKLENHTLSQRRRSNKAISICSGKIHLKNTSGGKDEEDDEEEYEEEKSEQVQTGTVSWRIYWNYLKSGAGFIKGLFLIALCLSSQAIFIGSDWWLSTWSNENEAVYAKIVSSNNSNSTVVPTENSNQQLAVYTGLFAGIVVFGLLRAFLFFQASVTAGVTLHNDMFDSLFHAPMSFFDMNPAGRILNRISKDLGQVDEILPFNLFDFLQCLLIVAGMVIMTGVVNLWVFIAIVPLSVLLVLVRQYYLKTSRQLQRLEGVTRSPVFSHLNATLQGLHTIRAFGNQRILIKKFDSFQDVHTSAHFLFICARRWLSVRLDWLCALFVTTTSFASVLAAGSLDAGFVGLSMTYAFAVMGIFQWTVFQSTTVENQMVAVERILDYCSLPSEASFKTTHVVEWPTAGKISAVDVNLRYFDSSPYIIKKLTMSINGGEKIGIVGRTGAGKSSLITLLMRISEFEGTVTIDGVDIQDISLHDLRSRISVIPQDPVLFTGKLRRNLDPFNEYGDADLWQVLEAVEMKETIEQLQLGVDTEVSEGGQNFSVGQRQLICLARAMLRNNKILIIDEATANVDSRTDDLIQQTIREKFNLCTVLTIAHRLNTVMDSDRIMVLDQGELVEFDHPFVLMQKTDGVLYNMAKQMGQFDISQLIQTAKKSYIRKHCSESITDAKMAQNTFLENETINTRL